MPIVVAPGQSTKVGLTFSMHEGMGGPHHFVVNLKTNDPEQREKNLSVKANFVSASEAR